MSNFRAIALILLALQITPTVGRKVHCIASHSGDTSVTGEHPSAAPTETSSPTCLTECVDDMGWRYASVDNQDCEWIGLGRDAEGKNRRCKLPSAKTRCPATCGQCRPGGPDRTSSPTSSPTPACSNLDEKCEPILINGVMTSLCTYLENLSNRDRNNMCSTRKYKALKTKDSACTYLRSSYPQAYNKQCDQSGRYIGNIHTSGAAVVTIAYSEICGQTCGVC